MKEQIYQIVLQYLPVLAAFIITTVLPIMFHKFIKKFIVKKNEELNKDNQLKQLKKELVEIKREILEMRGKIK